MKSLLTFITRTSGGWAPLIARLTLALVFFPHGAQKVLGWFGGYGFTGTMGYFTSQAHLPYAVALLPVANGIPRAVRVSGGIVHADRGAGAGVRDVRGHRDGPCRERFLHELVRHPEGRGL